MWERSDQLVFIEEERELEREALFEESTYNTPQERIVRTQVQLINISLF